MSLAPEQRRELLRVARDAIAAAVHGRRFDASPMPAAGEASGAFVSLHRRGELRGCIGQIEHRQPLSQAIAHCAVSAAVHDPRFTPLSPAELNATEIEISVLTPMQRVSSIDEIEVGRDGLYIKQGGRSGLLLPQVATEWGWDRETFLAQACRKAGLPSDAWRTGADIYRFQAEIFSEAAP